MNIIYFVHGFPPSIGAGAINAYEIAKNLSNYGHKMMIFSPGTFSKTSNEEYSKNFKNFNLDVKYSNKLVKIPFNLIVSHFENMAKFLLKYKVKFEPDIILSQYQAFHFASVVGGYVSKILRIPHIIRSHDIFFPTDLFSFPIKLMHAMNYTRIYRSILNCDIFYITTTEMKNYYLQFKKLRKVNFRVHYNGVDTSVFYPYKNQNDLKNKFGCENILLFVGQISRDFDLNYLLKILPDLLKAHKDLHLVIIGSGPHESYLKNYIKKNNFSKNIHFLGIKPHYEIPYYINNCDIGIGRITYENIWRYMIPVKCLEYMACKKPFITAPCSEDLILNNDVGLSLNSNFTEKELVDKLTLLIENKELRRKLGEKGHSKINEKFRWEKLISEFNNDLNQIKLKNK